MNTFFDLLAKLGRLFLGFLAAVGRLAIFAGRAISAGFSGPWYLRILGTQMLEIGYYSLPVIGLTAIFTGAVLALQSYSGFSRFNAESSIAIVVVLSITRELGPVLAGLMVAGRIGAAIAAEIGTMRVTEQIDALVTLSTSPFKYLVFPRVLAGTLMLPCLVLIADIIGVYGGYAVSIHKLGFTPGPYLISTWEFLKTKDVVSGPGESGRIRLHRHADGLLPRLSQQGRRAGRRRGMYHERGGVGVHPDPA